MAIGFITCSVWVKLLPEWRHHSSRMQVRTRRDDTTYGSQLDEGRRSSRYPFFFVSTWRGIRMLAPRLAVPVKIVRFEREHTESLNACSVREHSVLEILIKFWTSTVLRARSSNNAPLERSQYEYITNQYELVQTWLSYLKECVVLLLVILTCGELADVTRFMQSGQSSFVVFSVVRIVRSYVLHVLLFQLF